MRIVFMGTGEIGLPALRWLIEKSGYEIAAVFTQPDKPFGRKQLLTAPEVKTVALEHGIPVFQPERLRKNREALDSLEALDPGMIVVMAYGQILPLEVIEVPKIACINLHASLLPGHRGAAPIQAAIRAGDPETGITLMHIAEALDAGDMILKEAIPVEADETGGSLHDRLAELGPAILESGLPLLADGRAIREKQNDAEATYAPKLDREDGEIDWSCSAAEIDRMIRACDPWPGTYTWLETERGRQKVKIYPFPEVEQTGSGRSSDSVGSIHERDSRIEVVCGGGSVLRIGERAALQLEGRKRLPVSEFLRGQPVGKKF